LGWWLGLLAVGVACAAQPFVAGDPVVHVLVQMPALAAAGAVVGVRFHLPANWVGAVLILALTTGAIWMLPRSVDAALITWTGLVAKFITLPLFCGVPLGLSWPRIGPVLRGFLKAQAVSMLLLLGFLYTHAPLRICNSYLVDDQQRLGMGFVYVACALTVIWLVPVFTGPLKLSFPKASA
jgi:hypothetical protein